MLGRAFVWLATVIGVAVVILVVLGALGILRLYSTPSSSMQPTLRCAKPGLGCERNRSGSASHRIACHRRQRSAAAVQAERLDGRARLIADE